MTQMTARIPKANEKEHTPDGPPFYPPLMLGVNREDQQVSNVEYSWPVRHAIRAWEAMTMQKEYTAVVKEEGGWWFGWIEEIPGVNCQERTYEELIQTLEVTLREALEFNRRDALDAAGSGPSLPTELRQFLAVN